MKSRKSLEAIRSHRLVRSPGWKLGRILRWVTAATLLSLHPISASATSPDSLESSGNSLITAGAITTGYFALSMYVLGNTWYKDRETVPFHFYNDNAAWLQVDKCGHAFGAYVYSYVGYHGMIAAGMDRRDALLFGATLGAILQTPIEIMDGLHEGYGFSWGDILANTAGSGLVLAQEFLLREQLVKFKFSYSPSPYAQYGDGALGTGAPDRVLKDYNGQTYWLTLPMRTLTPEGWLPPWLSIAVGYGADGMYGEFDNDAALRNHSIPAATRRRQYLLSLDVDWTRIESESSLLRLLLQGLAFVKLPFPSIEFTSTGTVRGHWLFY
jgi:hypothetical protein